MRSCERCGEPSAERAGFCASCGAPLRRAPDEVRKTVTSLFADLVGSTALAQELDPEAYRDVMSRFFEAMVKAIQAHAGAVEKFIGDAVRATFGVPLVSEDDALRAVEAALDMRRRLGRLNDGLEASHGIRLEVRIGINSGEVIAGRSVAGQPLLVGRATTTAARLQQAARPGEILLGEDTFRLLRHSVEAAPIALGVKGRTDPITAYRVVAKPSARVRETRPTRHAMVGRTSDKAVLLQTFEDAAGSPACRLVTVVGTPGVGKSRLVSDFAAEVGARAAILMGRCLSYGEGITYWPLKEIIKQAAGIGDGDDARQARAKIEEAVQGSQSASLVTERLAQTVGVAEGRAAPEEIAAAARRLLQQMAARSPVVIIFEDLHWAEKPLLDVIEHLRDWSGSVPLLLLCVARPEILDQGPLRTEAGRIVSLQPLDPADSRLVLNNLAGDVALPERFSARLATMAGGNPLFMEQTMSMLIDDGILRRTAEGWITPSVIDVPVAPTIQVILAARLDRLRVPERAVLQCASVIGLEGPMTALRYLHGSDPAPEMKALVQKEFIERWGSDHTGAESFCLRHALIREAAYNSIPKTQRALLHERLGSWMEEEFEARVAEYEEIIGYHFEQAYRYRRELAPREPRYAGLGIKAAQRLASAGRRAHGREDMEGTRNLLSRASRLFDEDAGPPLDVVAKLGDALTVLRDMGACRELITRAENDSVRTGDRRFEAHSQYLRSYVDVREQPDYSNTDAIQDARRAVELCAELQDEEGHARSLSYLAWAYVALGRNASAVDAGRAAIAAAQRAGSTHVEAFGREILLDAMVIGPTPASEALSQVSESLEWCMGTTNRRMEAVWLFKRAELEAMLDRSNAARHSLSLGDALMRDLGDTDALLMARCFDSFTAYLYLGIPESAEAELRRALKMLQATGEVSIAASVGARLAELLCRQGSVSEAEALSLEARETTSADDPDVHIRCSINLARILLHKSNEAGAEGHARVACELADATDWLNLQGDARRCLGEVLRTRAPARSREALAEAARLYRAKENSFLDRSIAERPSRSSPSR
ncbi:MAG: AAA family ATPase [Actinomycetota bacterium]